jgi:hypothetical protein
MTYPHVVMVDVAKRLGVINARTESEHDGGATRLEGA